MSALLLPIAALLIDILIIYLFYSKKYQKNNETRIYSILIIVNFLECLLNVIGIFYIRTVGGLTLSSIIQKVDISMMVIFVCLILIYVYNISSTKKNQAIKKIISVLTLLVCIVVLIVPCHPIITETTIDSSGLAPIIAYGVIALYAIGIIICIVVSAIKNKKNISNKKYVPLYALVVLAILGLVLRTYIPQLIFEPFVMSYLVLMMYHTIENPDVKMIEQLDIAKTNAEKANRAKSDFLSSMSHEIRTPLNAIVGFSECILHEENLEDIRRDAKDVIMASQNLLEIVNGILDISKIEANKMEIVETDYELLPAIENISKLMIPRIGEKPIELKTNFAVDLPFKMHGDVGKIKQIITNILTNAVKYTEKGEITFEVNCVNENNESSLIISIEDTGRGIKPDKIDKLFSKFDRLDEDKNTTIEGTGLGLAITKSLIDMLGGKIVVQSKYGEGSKFTVYLKQKIVKLHPDETDKDIIIEEKELSFKGAKLLVVDDNKLNLRVADKIIKGYDIAPTLIESGVECIDLIKNGEKFDLIFMDDMMPRLTGTETLTRLKQIPNFNIPVISLTANVLSGEREKYIELGFDEYLAKPIEKQELEKILEKFLQNKNEIKNEVESKIVETKTSTESDTKSTENKVLIVDDNKINIKVAENFLKPYNFDINSVLSGSECIDLIDKGQNYDLIFMDDMMPNLSGVETLQKLKENENFDMPVVALTANAINGARDHYLSLGFDEYVSKPIDKQILDDVINKVIKKDNNTEEEIIIEDVETNENNTKGNIEYLKNNGVDIDSALELLGDIEMYNETLTEFKNGLTDKIIKLKRFKEANDLPNYAILVHSLKSECKYLGFTKLAEMSYEHELKSKANDSEFVINKFEELVKECMKLKVIIDKY